MTRLSLRRLFKTTILALAISTTIIPTASAKLVAAEGGEGASASSLDSGYGWHPSAIQTISNAAATEPPIVSPDDRAFARTSPTQAPVQVVSRPDGFSWGDAGIGAAGGLAVALLLSGMALVAVRQRPFSLAHR